jgi:cytoskeletal protein RodZ
MSTQLEERADAAPDGRATGNHEITVRVVAETNEPRSNRSGLEQTRRPRRRLPSLGSIVAALGIGILALVGFLIVGALTGLFSIGNPFGTSTIDRSQPALLKEINNLSRFDAAQGKFETTIDVEHDVSILPSFLAGDRTVFLAQGTVDATVDFSALSGNAVQQGADGHVTITLPAPTLGKAVLDTKASHVASRDRGLANRIGGVFSDSPTSERELYLLAQQKLASAAKESKLVTRAERNTTTMLQTFLGRLGYSDVQVTYTSPAESPKKLG